MPFFEKSQATNVHSGTFLDQSHQSHIDHPTYIDQRQISHIHPTPSGIGGFERLERAAIRQAIHDSSECSELKQPCCEGTREEHIREITSWGKGEWESTQKARVLWLYGPAGVGKSALAQSCARQIGKSKVAATFFFSRLNRWDRSGSLIPTICYQLAIRSQDYRNLITDTIAHDPFVLEKSFPDQFQELVVDPIAKLRAHDQSIFSNHLIILDGLDEADKVDTQIIIRTILHSVGQQSTPFLWAIFSRPESHIKTAFSSDLADGFIFRRLLAVSTDANKDIRLYLEDAFGTIRAKYGLPTSMIWPPEEAVDQLVDQSAGLFAYASNAIRYISGDGTNRPGLDDRFKAVLDLGKTRLQDFDNPFAHLDALYALIMSQIPQPVLPNTLALLCIRLNIGWGIDNQLLFYSSILRLRLPDLYAALNNLYSVLEVSKSASGIPLRISFYHASFDEFLHDIKRSTPTFHIGASDVDQRCFTAAVETLNRLSRYENLSKVDTPLSWPPGTESYLESHGHDLFVMATGTLFTFSEFMDPKVPVLTHLASVNWRFAINTRLVVATASWTRTFFQRIPKEWRSKIIQRPHHSPVDVLRQIFLDLRKGKKLKAVGKKRYVLGSGENKVWLEPGEYGHYEIRKYS
ncbi:hypothetical protein AN958_02489 [Leucoagaricus sp. SymC.cos]|nr:hypothetical protein AN958_02489 [Leucoagaricus sp. SymC.cos]